MGISQKDTVVLVFEKRKPLLVVSKPRNLQIDEFCISPFAEAKKSLAFSSETLSL